MIKLSNVWFMRDQTAETEKEKEEEEETTTESEGMSNLIGAASPICV